MKPMRQAYGFPARQSRNFWYWNDSLGVVFFSCLPQIQKIEQETWDRIIEESGILTVLTLINLELK